MGDQHLILEAIQNNGYYIKEGVLTEEYIKTAKVALQRAIEEEKAYHGNENYTDYGMVMLCSLYGEIFNKLFDNDEFLEPFEAVLGEGCIVYAYTSSSMPPNKSNYLT